MRHDISPRVPGRRLTAAAILLLALAGARSGAAQPVPSDAVLRDFQPIGDFALWVGGKEVPGAQIYQTQGSTAAILIMSSALPSPVVLMAGEGTASTVHIMKVAKQKDGSVDLLADAVLEPQSRIAVVGEDVGFKVAGKAVLLKTKPPLLGIKNAAALRAYSPTYGLGAQAYRPNGQYIASLKKNAKPVKVRVFFGSWCSFCKHYVPLVLKVEDELKGSKVQFEYFGLPRDLKAPEAQRLKVKTVPTGIVYVNGKEVGRISGEGWKSPEATLAKIIAGA